MKSTFRRVIAGMSLAALVSVIAASPSNAADQPTGVGAAGGDATLLSVDYTHTDAVTAAKTALLQLSVLGDLSHASIDPAQAGPLADETLSPLNVHADAPFDALNALTVTPLATSTTGGSDHQEVSGLNFNAAGFTATIDPASLTALVNDLGARSSLTAKLAQLQLLGGVGHLDDSSLDLGGFASPTSSVADRSLTADGLAILDLRGVLNLVGVDISDIGVIKATDLLEQLHEIDTLNTVLGDTFFEDGQDILDHGQFILDALEALQGLDPCIGNEIVLDFFAITCTGVEAKIAELQDRFAALVTSAID
ncbi:MAG: hypothetical protein QOG30_1170, partial [Acidimicrobiaceae bacterium]